MYVKNMNIIRPIEIINSAGDPTRIILQAILFLKFQEGTPERLNESLKICIRHPTEK